MSLSAGVYLGDLESTCEFLELNSPSPFPFKSLVQIEAGTFPQTFRCQPAHCPDEFTKTTATVTLK